MCRFVSNRGHPSFPEIVKDAKEVFNEKVNEAKVSFAKKEVSDSIDLCLCVISLSSLYFGSDYPQY